MHAQTQVVHEGVYKHESSGWMLAHVQAPKGSNAQVCWVLTQSQHLQWKQVRLEGRTFLDFLLTPS